MRHFFSVHNIGLKALALLLAVLLWVYLYFIQPGKLPLGIFLNP